MSASDIAISVRGLGKAYTIRQNVGAASSTLGEAITSRLRNPFSSRSRKETFWALKDVSFDIKKGEVVGIIGRNGAGKSTLLKILSRITELTEGEADLYGRVGSLLEVGTGFHQELSGRENIFLNGAILGMTRAEIRRQFDAIVDFAGVEKFLDTPVKRYSSGMFVRLAFAVAAHLRSEILIVDEVLAVGDAEFQKKCLGKMKEVSTDGRTVLFVSHNMHAIAQLCTSSLLVERGQLIFDGEVSEAIEKYMIGFDSPPVIHSGYASRKGSGEYRFSEFAAAKRSFESAESKVFRFAIERRNGALVRMYLAAQIYDESGCRLLNLDSRLTNFWIADTDRFEGRLSLGSPWLKPGRYRLDAYICTGSGIVDLLEGAAVFDVSSILPFPGSASQIALELGICFGDFEWTSGESRLSSGNATSVAAPLI